MPGSSYSDGRGGDASPQSLATELAGRLVDKFALDVMKSRIIQGAIKSGPNPGKHFFYLTVDAGVRVYFRGVRLISNFNPMGGAILYGFSSDLLANRWYSIVIHTCRTSNYDNGNNIFKLQWYIPGSLGAAYLPPENAAYYTTGGRFVVRFTDTAGVIRYMLAHKRWDGKALVLCYPLPNSVFNVVTPSGWHWPKPLSAGTLIEQVAVPIELHGSRIVDWGTGWTRRPGNSQITAIQPSVTSFNHSADKY